MRRFGSTSLLRMVCAVVGTTIALSGCAVVGSPDPDPAAPSSGRGSSPTQSPTESPRESPAGPRTDRSPDPADRQTPAPGKKLEPGADASPMGLDVRYVDENGDYKVLRVDDFPR